MVDLLLEGDPVELEAIRVEIEREIGAAAQLEPVNSTASGELREPLLVGLIVALGGPAVTHAIVKILRNRQLHREEMERIENEREEAKLDHERRLRELELRGEAQRQMWELQLKLIEGDAKRPVSLEDLAALA